MNRERILSEKEIEAFSNLYYHSKSEPRNEKEIWIDSSIIRTTVYGCKSPFGYSKVVEHFLILHDIPYEVRVYK
jgi:hypothetical protein